LIFLLFGLAPSVQAKPPAGGPIEEAVQKHLGIFQVLDELLDPNEHVEVVGPNVKIWFRQRLEPGRQDRQLCEGARWLISGRLDGVPGLKALFLSKPDLRQVSMVFYAVETSTRVTPSGRYEQSRRVVTQARFAIDRKRTMNLDRQAVSKALKRPDCRSLLKDLLTDFWVRKSG
jgi:hypothetical protein